MMIKCKAWVRSVRQTFDGLEGKGAVVTLHATEIGGYDLRCPRDADRAKGEAQFKWPIIEFDGADFQVKAVKLTGDNTDAKITITLGPIKRGDGWDKMHWPQCYEELQAAATTGILTLTISKAEQAQMFDSDDEPDVNAIAHGVAARMDGMKVGNVTVEAVAPRPLNKAAAKKLAKLGKELKAAGMSIEIEPDNAA